MVEDKNGGWWNQHPYFESAVVSVTRTRVEGGTSLPVNGLYTDTEPSGVPHRLSWQVEGWAYDTLYEVEIRNVTLQSGVTRSSSYSVFIDRASIEY